jgi:hypothetical protein
MSATAEAVIGKDDFAVMWSESEGYKIVMPRMPPDAAIPDAALALMGAFVRLAHDPEFVQECLDWVHTNKQ